MGKEKEKKKKQTKWFCHFIHFCAISPDTTAAEDQAGAPATAFCCVSGLAANHAVATALWERSSSSGVGRQTFIGPGGCRLRDVFFYLQAKRGAITKYLAESAAIYESASCRSLPQVRMWGCGRWRTKGMKRTEMKVSESRDFYFFLAKNKSKFHDASIHRLHCTHEK